MGDTADSSWGSRELGGFMRREEARMARDGLLPDETRDFLLHAIVHVANARRHQCITHEEYVAAYETLCVPLDRDWDARERLEADMSAGERWQVVVQVIGPDEEAVLESIYTYDSKEDAMEAAMKANEGIDAA